MIESIENDKQLEAALEALDRVFGAAIGTEEDAEAQRLIELIEAYEAVHYPIGR